MQIAAVKFVRQRLRPQRGEQRVVFGGAGKPQHQAETARVAVAQHGAVAKGDVQMVVLLRLGVRRIGQQDFQAARHAQMDQQHAGGKTDQQVFGAATAFEHRFAGQRGAECFRNRLAQLGLAHGNGGDGASFDMRRNAAQHGFDFRQFGHGFLSE